MRKYSEYRRDRLQTGAIDWIESAVFSILSFAVTCVIVGVIRMVGA